jgi:hypothetical protein
MLNHDPSDPDKMRLPVGKTCGDCLHIKRCKAIFGHVESGTCCDWSPSRFRAAIASAAVEQKDDRDADGEHIAVLHRPGEDAL